MCMFVQLYNIATIYGSYNPAEPIIHNSGASTEEIWIKFANNFKIMSISGDMTNFQIQKSLSTHTHKKNSVMLQLHIM